MIRMVETYPTPDYRLLCRVWQDKHIPGQRGPLPQLLLVDEPDDHAAARYNVDDHVIVLYGIPHLSRRDRRLYLLHEIAHALLRPYEGHGATFRLMLAVLEHRYGGGWHGGYSLPVCTGEQPSPRLWRKDWTKCPQLS